MSLFKSIKIDTNNASGDAFGRQRISNPQTIFDSKFLSDDASDLWDDQEVSGSGTNSAFKANEASVQLIVSATTAGKRVRQTFQRFNYQAGKSQLVFLTGVVDATGGGTGITTALGVFDDDNGIFFRNSEGTYEWVIRSKVTGSAVDNNIPQASWNLDTMDGNGPSGITLDFSRAQIFVIDYEWLGVGRVRVGFNVDGVTYYVHEFLHANNINTVYMSTPNLPIRYEIENDGTGVASTMDQICSTVISEGGQVDVGLKRYASTTTAGGGFINANTSGTVYALIGIRLKSTHLTSVIKEIAVSTLALTPDNFEWIVLRNPTVAGTFTYNSHATDSPVEIAYGDSAGNPSTNTVTGGEEIDGGFVVGDGAARDEISDERYLGSLIDGTPDEVVLCVRPLSANLDIHGSLIWKEI